MTQEQLRQHYLEAMGIESYVPRWPLPGAAASPVPLDEPVNDEFGGEELESVQHSAPVQPDVAAIAAGLKPASGARPRIEVELEAEERNPRAATPATEAAATRPLRFTLNVWQVSEHILVLDSRQDLALPVGRLLHNMATALGFGSDGVSAPENFRWPLTDGAERDAGQSESDARAGVQAFLAARAARRPLRYVLLMGAPAVRFALHKNQQPDGSFRALLGKTLPLEIDGVHLEAIALPSLANMLQYPESKAAVWAAIKHLRAPRA